jgi:hypothetical protein
MDFVPIPVVDSARRYSLISHIADMVLTPKITYICAIAAVVCKVKVC